MRVQLAIHRDLAREVPLPHRVGTQQTLREYRRTVDMPGEQLALACTTRRSLCAKGGAHLRAHGLEIRVGTWRHHDDEVYRSIVGADEIRSLLIQLQAKPNDVELRRRTAEALDASGQRDDATAVLAPLVNLTGHDDDTGLPCLCKTCLPVAPTDAEAAGMQFKRSFAVSGIRVLHFWQLADQDRSSVRTSVSAAIAARLAAQKVKDK